ncbi:MAG: DNA polymerase III subunit gamma/tau [Planctomycetota bacterium]|nr:DNA polymerase III subunit gamma/tau [Planctomycetota bacterium]
MNEQSPTPPAVQNDATSGRYEVIARRYRPRKFDDVVGQESVAEALRQAILQNRLAHAYLFCGPRGVGKTSMARIFARTLQCPDGEDAVPCDQCATCEQIFRGEDSDVTEMDGASHRGIDDIRSLIEHVQYAPSSGPYRIFIIDEVHMLTREAFNSLLKTLEEPPAHVKFIFATTEPERVIPTVLSRCQRFDFASISRGDIERRLGQICQQEGADPQPELLENIASLADGGMRDAQSLLDQVLSFAGDQPGPEDLNRITGRVSSEALADLLSAVDCGDLSTVVAKATAIFAGGTEASVLTEQIAETLRQRLHTGVSDGWGEEDLEANLLAQEIIQETRQKLRRQDRGDLLLELALMRMGTLRSLVPIRSLTSPDVATAAASISRSPRDQDPDPPVAAVAKEPTVPDAAIVPEQPATKLPARGAAAAREALRKREGDAKSSGVASAVATTDADPVTEGDSPEDQLIDLLRKVDKLLPRMIRLGGGITRVGDGWQLQTTSELSQALATDAAQKALSSWQKKHGSIEIEEYPADADPAPGSSGSAEKPEIVGQAADIFSSEAKNRGPVRDEDRVQGNN